MEILLSHDSVKQVWAHFRHPLRKQSSFFRLAIFPNSWVIVNLVERHLLSILHSLPKIVETNQTQQRDSLVDVFGILADLLNNTQ